MIEQALAKRILEKALETGADFAELYIEDTQSNSVSMQGGIVEDATYSRKSGAGVRVLLGTAYSYAYCSGITESDLMKAAKNAADGISGKGVANVIPFTPASYGKAPRIPASEVNNARRIELIRTAADAAASYSNEITQTTARITDTDKRVLICNNEGVFAQDRRANVRFVINAVASANGEAQSGSNSPGMGQGYECFEAMDLAELGRAAARAAITMLHAKECPAGTFPVVIDGGFGGVIFHEACGHSLEATSVSKGNSEFCGKLGKKIAASCVTAIDDGIMENEWGSLGCDDEGAPSKRRVLIENGILKSYLIDRLGARRMNSEPTASSRRQDYTFAPTSRMTNTFIAQGTDDDDTILSELSDGLYAKQMGGGSVNPLTGEFNFAVSEGYWVRDGKILCAVRGATLIGKGSEVLLKIDRVGKKMWQAAGMCGSASGSVPTNVGQPRIRVSSMIVGGKGGAI